jgi:uncharacterized protein YbbK (DUF523 family)
MSGKSEPRAPLLVSACLIGSHCRYDGGSKPSALLRKLALRGRVLPLCPEQLGGLTTPRPPASIADGDGEAVLVGRAEVLGPAGEVLSDAFRRGATRTLALARGQGCRVAVLKERSPSCGVCRLSSPEGSRKGRGVTAALLADAGLQLISDEDRQLAKRLEEYHDADA